MRPSVIGNGGRVPSGAKITPGWAVHAGIRQQSRPFDRQLQGGSDVGSVRGRYAIVGIGETETGKLPGVSTLALHLEAIRRALGDAGLRNDQVDGLLTNQPMHDPMRSYSVVVAHAAGITPRYTTDLALGGATPVAMVHHAVMAIEAGLATTVVCV